MLFNSFDFLLFFAVVFGVQLVLPHRARNLFLLAASCFFYACWDWRFLGLLWVTIVTDYAVSRCLGKATAPWVRKSLVGVSCSVNLGILAFFKYANFFADSASQLMHSLGFGVQDWQLRIVLPVGISFYTFQSMSYTIDVYRGKMEPLRSLIDYGLFVSLFPQMVAGPIERGTHLAAQVLCRPRFSWQHCCDGSWLILKGLVKKAVMADNLAVIADRIFSAGNPGGPDVLLGVFAFAFQIYGDFSGYTDMARGIGKWLGYDLMLNFCRPYFATDPSDFWQRWHISLSTWLRDYLYIPLGGNRGSEIGTCRNLMVTMLLGGLWHGANWTYLVWGAYHGMLLVAFRLWSGQRAGFARPATNSALWWLRVFCMFQLTCIGWLFFRAASLAQIGQMLTALASNWTVASTWPQDVWQVAVLCGPLLLAQWIEESSGNADFIPNLSVLPRSVAYAGLLMAILALGIFGGREFIYFRF